MTTPDPIRIVVVDDQELVRTGLRMILESEPGLRVVGEAADGADAAALAARAQPDIVLMDIRMPVMNGVEATARVLAEVRTRVVILTTFDLDEYVFAALRNGASGFLLKDTPANDLIAALQVVAGGEALLAPTVTRRLIEHYRNGASTVPEPPQLGELTEREREVLVEMARGRSNAEIAAALYVSETTVKTHVSRVLAKLDLRDRVQAVVLAYECGLVRPGSFG